MRTFVLFTLMAILILGSLWIIVDDPRAVERVSQQIITFVSIVSAAVMACIFSVAKNLNLAKTKRDKTALFFVSHYWVRFFCVCALNAFLVILGGLLNWPTIDMHGYSFGVVAFLSLASLSILVSMIFVDFPSAIRDALYIEQDVNSENNLPRVPDMANTRTTET